MDLFLDLFGLGGKNAVDAFVNFASTGPSGSAKGFGEGVKGSSEGAAALLNTKTDGTLLGYLIEKNG